MTALSLISSYPLTADVGSTNRVTGVVIKRLQGAKHIRGRGCAKRRCGRLRCAIIEDRVLGCLTGNGYGIFAMHVHLCSKYGYALGKSMTEVLWLLLLSLAHPVICGIIGMTVIVWERTRKSSALKRQVNNALIAGRGDLDFSKRYLTTNGALQNRQWETFRTTALR